jgi:dephospho-CoA kinase
MDLHRCGQTPRAERRAKTEASPDPSGRSRLSFPWDSSCWTMTIVLCISGRIGSGKSVLAQRVGAKLGWRMGSFSKVLRSIALKRGIAEPTREDLQRIGTERIQEGCREFCLEVLDRAGWHPGEGLVIDGVRHSAALDALSELVAPEAVALVFINASDESLAHRLDSKDIQDLGQLLAIEQDSTEREVTTDLVDRAALVVESSNDPDAMAESVVSWVKEGMRSRPEPPADGQ